MKYPKKLNKCTIENSLYAFEFETAFNRSYIETKIVDKLKSEGIHLDRFLSANDEVVDTNASIYCYTDGVFKFIIEDRKILFNIVNGYPGWESFSAFIAMVLRGMPTDNLVYKSIATRYISSYVNISLFKALNGIVKLNAFDDIIGGELRYPVEHENVFSGLVRVTNRLPVKEDVQVSYADVEIQTQQDISTFEQLMSVCSQIHDYEKEDFFKIMNPEFIKELDPEYD